MVDKKLVKRAKRGNKEALLTLIMNKKDEYYRLAFSYMGNEQDAMDAMEDMIVSLYEKIYQLRKDESFYFWSKKILINSCKTLLRKKQKVVFLEDVSYFYDRPLSSSRDAHKKRELQMDIEQLLSHLNADQREAIVLKYFHDLDYETISQMTDVPLGTVKSRIFQGLKKLRDVHGGDRYEKY
ncbi:sigma-70 family RNA polymerase sigma factor [Fervidibacillus halotolerans]|uniref:Sigma-70 family RNA polymerase sigma factor n=1 Tax=Fervidibacillus halotolerans TaxID=2980027 RepID=A0A9E8LZL0_9BACI|nr:sigma-70 family RNA polymerase sigma factor [Fervidibacillus halotolerans]WAA12471.1 sigma-70 family RNA polymerase sigma factor [Fervidibacillus halotolerans]